MRSYPPLLPHYDVYWTQVLPALCICNVMSLGFDIFPSLPPSPRQFSFFFFFLWRTDAWHASSPPLTSNSYALCTCYLVLMVCVYFSHHFFFPLAGARCSAV